MNARCRELILRSLIVCLTTLPLVGEEQGPIEPEFDRISTRDGTVYEACSIKSSDPEGVVIEHSGGLARISLFDLPAELQERFGFDPVVAMKVYRENEEKSRQLRKQRLLESTRLQAEAERKATAEAIREKAEEEWIPVEADILKINDKGAFASVRRITFVPTTKVSSLGFESPGPPKRVMQSFGRGIIFLKSLHHPFTTHETWKGYLEPTSISLIEDPETGQKTIPVHLAVPPR